MRLINISNNVRTAGAYVLWNGRFVFQVGPTKDGNKLGVVRLGGHRENKETGIETATREVLEEASMIITAISAPTTYYKAKWSEPATQIKVDDISPVLVIGSHDESLSVMYLAYSDSEPAPSSETSGLLLLSSEEVHFICENKITLREYISRKGVAQIKNQINHDLILEPFPQLLFLSKLLKEDVELMNRFMYKNL